MARKILLADDSVTAQNMGRKILADAGYEVVTVNNGSAALKKIAETHPDLIVLDVYMPGYSGLEVCQRLKENGESARIPVLLTVGKLEPFKPEEAKRVRADGFIVKPFEASELLSALTKLEDKIVPRAESSKPGRFARSIAAIEEGRYDRTTAADDDSGWKNRIGFPHATKEKAEEKADGDDPAIYNAVNKDMRTTVEHAPAHAPESPSHMDLSALAPPGLPKDVTPEEIAALAAAAAQVQHGIESAKKEEPAEVKPQATAPDAEKIEQKTEAVPEPVQPVKPEFVPPQPVQEVQQLSEPQAAATEESASPEAVATAAVHQEAHQEANETPNSAHEVADQPITMAVATAPESVAAPSRWSAVAVALATEESAASLEDEMRAATAVAEPVVPDTNALAIAEGQVVEESTSVAAVASDTAMPEAAHALEAVASIATEAISQAIEQLEASTAMHAEPSTAIVEAPPLEAQSNPSAEMNSTPSTVEHPETEHQTFAPRAASEPVFVAEPASEPASELAPESHEEVAERIPEPVAVVASVANETPEVAEEPSYPVAQDAAEVAQPAPEKVHGGADDMAKKESEIAEKTAAAWASWRRVRGSDDPMHSGGNGAPQDEAAMAVAAGAEKAPVESASADSDAEIASIVDSVLADLRPKIVEEITRKLGKKK